ncbi:hypothetical protein HKCCE2091_02275 [Rhodobacterales bacterium HKCCE2091]|nr:hypothetical protein [Rhodobacterales bacterium HKCCE2091]
MSAPTLVLGDTPIAAAFLAGPAKALGLDVKEVVPIHRAFRPMVEDTAFDISELAIVAAIQAAEAGRPVIPLPVTISSRFQHRCLVQNRDRTALTTADLPGHRIAVRAYSQTTGAWVRTILDTEYGIDPRSVEWVTEEASHVAGAPEPANVVRDPAGTKPYDLLRDGLVDAAIFGIDMPDDPWIAPVIPDPDAAARENLARTGVVQINHVVAVSPDLAERDPGLVRRVVEGFAEAKAALRQDGPDMLPIGADAMRRSVETLLGSVHRQGLTTRRLSFENVFGRGMELLG